MSNYISPTITAMAQAARKAGKYLMRDFNEIESLKVSQKGIGEFVTSADLRSEKIIIQELKKFQPDYCILSEEKGMIEGTTNSCFVIDPLDGTTNFIHGLPYFTISIGLRKKQEVLAGVVYEPFHDSIYWAEKGKGSYLNNTRLRVSERHSTNDALISVRYSKDCLEEKFAKFPHKRFIGCASLTLAYIASGRLDLYIDHGLSSWDLSAGVCLIKEAGGKIDDLMKTQNVMDSGNVLAGNAYFFDSIRSGQFL